MNQITAPPSFQPKVKSWGTLIGFRFFEDGIKLKIPFEITPYLKGVKVWSTQTTGPRIGIGAKSFEELNRKIRLKFDLGEVWTVFSI